MPKPRDPNKPVGWRKPKVEFTDELAQMFLIHYRDNGVFYHSAELCGVVSTTVYDRIKNDPEFAAAVREAKDGHTDDLVRQAIRLSIEGVEEPIIGGKYKDEIVAHKRYYSERLLELLLKTRREEFRCRDKVDDDGAQKGGVMIVPSRTQTMDDWEKEYGEDAKGNTGKPEKP